MLYRRAVHEDLDQLVELQNQNLRSKLSEDEQRDGFLSAGFTSKQFGEFNDNLAVVVGEDEGVLVGFLVTSTPEHNLSHALPAQMISRYPNLNFRGRALTAYKSLIAGPVCVAKEHRGKGIFEGMYEALPRILPEKIELAVTLVSTENPRSLRAHEKVGLERVDLFHFNNREFQILAKLL